MSLLFEVDLSFFSFVRHFPVHMFNDILPLLMDDWFVHFMDVLLLDNGLVNFMNHRLMMLVQNRFLHLHSHVLVVLMNLFLMSLLDNWLVSAYINFWCLLVAFNDLRPLRPLKLSFLLVLKD